MSKLLLDSYPVVVIPELAVTLGLNEAIVLQQVHYWLENNKKTNKNHYEGRYWTYNSYEEWQKQFPWWSVSTVRRTLTLLEKGYERKRGMHKYPVPPLLISGNFNRLKIDRTKWYTIDYDTLGDITGVPSAQIGQLNRQDWAVEQISLDRPIPETTTETTTKTTEKQTNTYSESAVAESRTADYKSFPTEEYITLGQYLESYGGTNYFDPNSIEATKHYITSYRRIFNTDHPRYTKEKWSDIIDSVLLMPKKDMDSGEIYISEDPYDYFEIIERIDTYFRQRFRENCNYAILHFLEPEVKWRIEQKVRCGDGN